MAGITSEVAKMTRGVDALYFRQPTSDSLALPFHLLPFYSLYEQSSINPNGEIYEVLYSFGPLVVGDLVFNIFFKSFIKAVFKSLYIPPSLDYIMLEL